MLNIVITLLVALVGGAALHKLKVPGGMMVGAILAVTLLSISSNLASMPSLAKVTAQCLAGAFIACGISREDLKSIPRLWKPLLVLLCSLLAVNLLTGILIWRCSPLDPLTAMLSSVPGGMSDTPIIASDMGADAGKVAILQFIRMSSGIGLFPSLILFIAKDPPAAAPTESAGPASGARRHSTAAFLITLATAFLCGIAGKLSGIPAGALVFSMFGVIALKLLTGIAYLPMWAKRLAQVLSGAYIGCGISRSDLLEMRYLILPAIIILVGYFLNSLLTGHLLHRLFGYSRKAAMLIATPAGASDMALISADLGVTDQVVIELQVIRMVVVISLFPQIIAVISKMLT